jgi:spore germination protein
MRCFNSILRTCCSILVCSLGAALFAQTPPVVASASTSGVGAADALSIMDEPPLVFPEAWAFLRTGDESLVPPDLPVTDLAYFSARISSKGALFGLPGRKKLDGLPGRKHLVVAEVSNQALNHFILNPAYPLRDRLVADIAAGSLPYDGVVIDFELLLPEDGPNLLQFLVLLKKAIGSRLLTVCVPARTGPGQSAYLYQEIADRVDRVFVMAYDEHWSGSGPGPVASLAWTRRVSAFALKNVPVGKLIMGMPFYGRAWGERNPAGAYRFSSVQRVLGETGVQIDRDEEGLPLFQFQESIAFTMHFDDVHSIRLRLRDFQDAGIKNIGFWSFGLEDPRVWSLFRPSPP